MDAKLHCLSLVRSALQDFGARCFDNAVFDLNRLDGPMAMRIGRRLCEKGGPRGFQLGRDIMAAAECL